MRGGGGNYDSLLRTVAVKYTKSVLFILVTILKNDSICAVGSHRIYFPFLQSNTLPTELFWLPPVRFLFLFFMRSLKPQENPLYEYMKLRFQS